MFSQPVVFVIGAGASAEYRLPVGAQLKTDVARAVGDSDLLNLLSSRGRTPNYEQAGRELAKIIPSFVSIDEALNWFNSRRDIIELGKTAIVRSMLRAEQSSLLFNQSDPSSISDIDINHTWLPNFLSMIMAESKKDEAAVAFRHLTIINFNYDRTIEHYIYSALQRNFGLEEDRAREIVTNLKVLRPYGTVGPLPSQSGENPIPFGAISAADDYERLVSVAGNIRSYTEQAEVSAVNIQSELERSRMVVFLGFGFHQQNMNLLRVSRAEGWRRVFATGMGMHEDNHPIIKTAIATTVGTNQVPLLVDWSAANLLVQLRPALMAAARM